VRTRAHLPKLKRLHGWSNAVDAGSSAPQEARIKIQFNGVGGLRTYIGSTHIEQRIAQSYERPR
jgi:hypothetical protein